MRQEVKYALDLMVEFGDDFGKCPVCGCMGTYEYDGPRRKDDNDYFEVGINASDESSAINGQNLLADLGWSKNARRKIRYGVIEKR